MFFFSNSETTPPPPPPPPTKTKRKLYTPRDYVDDPYPEDSPKVRTSEVTAAATTNPTSNIITWRYNQPPPMFRQHHALQPPPTAVATPKRLAELKKNEPATPKITASVRKRAKKGKRF